MKNPTIVLSSGTLLRRVLSTAALALVLGAGVPTARAADSNPPDRLTYQGSLVDANGAVLAPVAPVNYDVVFRIYDSQTGGNLVWAEKQTVTVSKGRFSVLLGEGAVNGSELRPALSSVFTGTSASDRFLELTATIGTTPLTITPRLQLVTSPYAFTARNATTLVSPNGNSLVTAANAALTVNGSVTATSFSGDGANLTGINAANVSVGTLAASTIPNLDGSKINVGSVPDNRLTANIPKLNVHNTFNNDMTVLTLNVNQVRANHNISVKTFDGFGVITVRGSGNAGHTSYGYLNSSGNVGTGSGSPATSIWAEQRIQATEFNAYSDARIKNIIGRSDGVTDLATIMGIEVTDYTHKDAIQKGDARHKKVIAQQVEKVYPQAVSKGPGAVPDIYKKAMVTDGWVQLAAALKVGDRVRLISEKTDGAQAVLAVRDGAFRAALPPGTTEVFVYGREVNDFRSVDYEALSMLNLSATQEMVRQQRELSRQVEALRKSEARIAELEQKAAQVEVLAQKAARVDGLERDLAELKKLVARIAGVRAGEQPAAEVVPASAIPTAKQ